jgi:peroxiredoxin
MQDHTDTLQLGSKAPEFTLPAANRDGEFTLTGLIGRGALVLEFLRGTW